MTRARMKIECREMMGWGKVTACNVRWKGGAKMRMQNESEYSEKEEGVKTQTAAASTRGTARFRPLHMPTRWTQTYYH